MYSRAFDTIDLKRNHAVVEQQLVSGLEILVQCVEGNTNAVDRAFVISQRAVQKKGSAADQLDVVVPESLDANLGTLQVAHQADIPAALFRRGAQAPCPPPMLVRISVREIQARDIEASADHLAQDLFLVGRRAQRCYYFRPFLHGGDYCTGKAFALARLPVSVFTFS
jgi:hypothetical protein